MVGSYWYFLYIDFQGNVQRENSFFSRSKIDQANKTHNKREFKPEILQLADPVFAKDEKMRRLDYRRRRRRRVFEVHDITEAGSIDWLSRRRCSNVI